jgi:DNA-directed RNA polymerase specialized sigma24 family protein
VIVLRYWEQRSETETAALLGCSEGTVKSTAARGLQHLRELSATSSALADDTDHDPAELTEKNS